MEECIPTVNTGLRGVKVATTKISKVDGAAGKLIYRGYLVKDLAETATYEEIIYLLLFEKLPNPDELAQFKEDLAQKRPVPDEVISNLKSFPKDAPPMDVLQSTVAMLATQDPQSKIATEESYTQMAIRLIAQLPTVLAAWERTRTGKEVVAPRDDLNQATNFLYMLKGEMPDEDTAQYFDCGLVLHAEHAFNASTFTARQIASSRAHLYAAISGAIGSLSGELHGGANVRVMEMLLKIGSLDKVEEYVNQQLDEGKVIFGLGHAVYQTDDPRARILEPMCKTLGERKGEPQWFEITKALEKTGKAVFKERKNRDIYVNVDFYSASLYYSMDIPIDFFTPVFAISRVAGWSAHVIEERFGGAATKPTLYRPSSNYVGEYCGPDECAFVPLDNRD